MPFDSKRPLASQPARHLATLALATAALIACGGGGGDAAAPPDVAAGCDVPSQNTWLRAYLRDTYYWNSAAPSPDPTGFVSVQSYFEAQLFAGNAAAPADRWSYIQDTASHDRFFGEGSTLGYGLFINGVEARLPLKVRFTEAASPAAAAGLVRGQIIASINGTSAAELAATGDYTALSPAKAGDVLTVVVETPTGTRTVALSAATYGLTPVPVSSVLTLPDGGKAGYLVLKDFITQAEAPLASAIDGFRAAGATELIVDLRYNGGGRLSTASKLASLIAGEGGTGKVFTRLEFNAKQAARNFNYTLSGGTGSAFNRVVVLTGPRTCSASELIVNGLKPHVNVVTIGAATCGKPFGFVPTAHCASTYSAVNFESFNALGQGRYYDGIGATCAATDDFSGTLGSASEPMTATALNYLSAGNCAVVNVAERQRALAVRARVRSQGAEAGERQGMWAD